MLWGCEFTLAHEIFRSGAKNSPAADFLRIQDLYSADHPAYERRRITDDELDRLYVTEGHGISFFIDRHVLEGFSYVENGPASKGRLQTLKEEFGNCKQVFWWKILKGQPIPYGLKLIFDNNPIGHCTLTVDKGPMLARKFLEQVSKIKMVHVATDVITGE